MNISSLCMLLHFLYIPIFPPVPCYMFWSTVLIDHDFRFNRKKFYTKGQLRIEIEKGKWYHHLKIQTIYKLLIHIFIWFIPKYFRRFCFIRNLLFINDEYTAFIDGFTHQLPNLLNSCLKLFINIDSLLDISFLYFFTKLFTFYNRR